jgi:hypothetical protein
MQFALREISGKQSAGQVSRRSIPAEGPGSFDHEATDIEELESIDLVAEDAKGSWGSNAGERTVVAQAQHVPEEAIPSAITRPVPAPRAHPADEDGPTLAVPSSITDPSELAPSRASEAPTDPRRNAYPSTDVSPRSDRPGPGMMDAQSDGGTLIMESPAAAHEPGGAGTYPPIGSGPHTAPKPFGQTHPFPQHHDAQPQQQQHQQHQQHQQQLGQQLRSTDGDLRHAAAQTGRRPAIEASGSNRVLVFLGVVVVTMVVVIAAGLVILGMSD